MMVSFEKVRECVEEEVISCYKELHQYPELGFLEKRTAKFIEEKLKSYGVEVRSGLGREGFCDTGVLGIIKGGEPGKTVVLRADIDALPIEETSGVEYSSKVKGVMHACGHDAHASMLLGAAKYFAENRHLIEGEVRFVFQPGEEGPAPEKLQDFMKIGRGGADQMIEADVLLGADACFGIHVIPTLPTGELMVQKREAMASTDMYKIEVVGQGGHGSAPHLAVDPVPAAAEILGALNMFPAREVDPLESCVLSVGTINTPSSSWNIIPERVEISGTFRTFSTSLRERVAERIGEISENIAKAHRCKATYTRFRGYNPTINNEDMVELVKESAEEYLKRVHLEDKPFTGGEDFGSYLREVQGALIWLGCGIPEEENPVFAHNPGFKVDLNALTLGVQVHVNTSLRYLKGEEI